MNHVVKVLPEILYKILKGDVTKWSLHEKDDSKKFSVGDVIKFVEHFPTSGDGDVDCEVDVTSVSSEKDGRSFKTVVKFTYHDPMKAVRDLYEWAETHRRNKGWQK